jgi:hypothetical protein
MVTMARVQVAVAAGVLVLLCAGPVASARQGAEKQIVVSVMNLRSGTPVQGVTPASLVVKEDGTERQIVKVEPATAPMSVVLLADNTSAMTRYTGELKAAAKSFFTSFMEKHSGSSASLWTFAGAAVAETKFLTDTDKLVEEAGKLRGRDIISKASEGESSLLEAVGQSSRELAKRSETRRVIVSFNTVTPSENSKFTKQQVFQELQKANVSWFAVTFVDGGSTGSLRDSVMTEVLPYSGGLRLNIQEISKLQPALQTLVDTLSTQYVVTYQRPSGSAKEVTVEVKGEGLRAFYPHWAPK